MRQLLDAGGWRRFASRSATRGHPRPFGGGRSSVAAASDPQGDGDRLTCVFVDPRCFRLDEGRLVMETFANRRACQVGIAVDARRAFSAILAGGPTPEPAQDHRPRFVEVFTRRPANSSRRSGWAGHDLSRRHRMAAPKTKKAITIKSHPTSAAARDARLNCLRALSELSRTRCARLVCGTRPAARHRSTGPFPGPAWRAHPRRGKRDLPAPCAARPMRSHRGAAQHHRSGQQSRPVRADRRPSPVSCR